MNRPVLSLRNVTKQIGKKEIVRNLSFDVYPGEIFGFLGPNGAGKTTTIRMIVGLTKITSGEITINNSDISKNYKKAIEHVGTIVENPELYPYLTAEKNLVHYGRMSKNVTKEDIQQRLELVKLSHVKDQKVTRFSLGMKQRLGIAQAMLHKPKILILDEPTNGLDPAGIREMRDYLRKVAKEENVAILVSSHVLSEMELMCDRFAIIQKGELVQVEDVHKTNSKTKDTYAIEVNHKTKAEQLLNQQGYEVKKLNEYLKVQATKEEMGNLNTHLTSKGITVFEITREEQSLEDRFLQATKEEVS